MNKKRITVLRVCIKLTIMLHIVNWTSNPRIRDWRVLYIGARGNVPLDQIYLFQTTSPNDTVGGRSCAWPVVRSCAWPVFASHWRFHRKGAHRRRPYIAINWFYHVIDNVTWCVLAEDTKTNLPQRNLLNNYRPLLQKRDLNNLLPMRPLYITSKSGEWSKK